MVLRRVKRGVKKAPKGKVAKAKRSRKADTISMDEEMLNHMIQERAYYIWQDMGNPSGCDYDIWFQAEKDILSKMDKR